MAVSTSTANVFFDFDGTVIRQDSFDEFLHDCAPREKWEPLEEAWDDGNITSRQCMEGQTELLRGGLPALDRVLARIEIDPTFRDLVKWCRQNNIATHIVSDGTDYGIGKILEREKLAVDSVRTNHLEQSHADESPRLKLLCDRHPRLRDDCGSGTCKCQALNEGLAAGKLVVFAGDGTSDLCAAKFIASKGGVVFAKKKLLKHCQEQGIEHIPFTDFNDIRLALSERLGIGASATQP